MRSLPHGSDTPDGFGLEDDGVNMPWIFEIAVKFSRSAAEATGRRIADMDVPVAVAPAPIPALDAASPGSPASAPLADAATVAAPVSPAVSPPFATDQTLKPLVAKLFNAQAQNVEVSFQVVDHPNEIVIVFTDKSTGKEIIQFPSQTLIALAKLYNKFAGSVVDTSV